MPTTLLQEVSRVTSLKKRGKRWVGLCPFHAERTPSFAVDEAREFFHCFGCGVHGHRGDFLRRVALLEAPPLRHIALRPRPDRWGTWRFVAANFTLVENSGYEIDLDRCCDSAEVLDWILQIAAKQWATPTVLAHLVGAFRDLLNPQATMCSFGQSTRINPREVEGTTRTSTMDA